VGWVGGGMAADPVVQVFNLQKRVRLVFREVAD